MDESNKYGRFFKKTLKSSEYSAAQMSRELGVNPQRITHWQRRGVAAKYAQTVAGMLRVQANQISDLKGDPSPGVLNARVDIGAFIAAQVYEELTPEKQLAAVLAIADSASPADAITYAEFFLARAKAGIQEK